MGAARHERLHGTAHQRGNEPVQAASVAELTLAVQPPAEGVPVRRETAGVVPARRESLKREPSAHGAGSSLVVPRSVAELAADVQSPTRRNAATREATGVRRARGEEREA